MKATPQLTERERYMTIKLIAEVKACTLMLVNYDAGPEMAVPFLEESPSPDAMIWDRTDLEIWKAYVVACLKFCLAKLEGAAP